MVAFSYRRNAVWGGLIIAVAALAAWFALRQIGTPGSDVGSEPPRRMTGGEQSATPPQLRGTGNHTARTELEVEGEPPDVDADQELETIRTIGGRVSNPSGDPLEGVRVSWEPPQGIFPPEPRSETRTDSEGAWTLVTSVRPGGGGWLSFAQVDYVDLRRPNGPVAPIGDRHVAILHPATRLVLRISDATGRPVESAAVEFKPTESGPLVEGLGGETSTDAEGESVLLLPAGHVFEIVVSAHGFMTETARVRGGATHEVHLRASASVRLRATDSDTGQLLAGGAELYRKDNGRMSWVGSGEVERGLHVFSCDIAPGTYSATVRKYGWRKASVQIEVPEDQLVVDASVFLHAEKGFECVSVPVRCAGEDEASLEGRTLHILRQPGESSGEEEYIWTPWSQRHNFESVVNGCVTLAIHSGDTCDLLLVDGGHDLVAIVGNRILRDPGWEQAVVLHPGHVFYFTPAKWGIQGAVADVAVTSERFGPLPLASLEAGAGTFYPNVRQALNERMGPYPPNTVVRVTPEVGEPVELTVQEAAK